MNCKPLIIAAGALLFLVSCQKKEKLCNGIQKKTYTNTLFDKIAISSQLQLSVVQGNTFSVEIEGCANDLTKMKVEQDGGVLQVWRSGNEKPAEAVYVNITMPELSAAEINGAVTGEISHFNTDIPRVFQVTGTSNIKFNGNGAETVVEVAGPAIFTMAGNGSSYTAHVSGAGQLLNVNYKVDQATIYLAGDALAHVYTYNSLVGEISGASKLFYWGHPPQVEVTRSGQATLTEK